MSRSQAFTLRNATATVQENRSRGSSTENLLAALQRPNKDAPQFMSDNGDEPFPRPPFYFIEIAKEIQNLSEMMDKFGIKQQLAKASNDASAATYYESAVTDAYDRQLSLRDALCSCEAASLEDAMVQIAEAIVRADTLDEGGDSHSRRQQGRAVARLLYSALRAIERSVGRNLTSLGLDSLHNPHCDPWEDVDKRLAWVREQVASSQKEYARATREESSQ